MEFKAFIEIPKGSKNKYERDEETGEIMLDRALYGPVHFPFEYGHVQGTMGEDGDPLDVVVLSETPTFPGCVIEVEPLGYLDMEDEGGIDHKVIARPKKKIEPRLAHLKDIKDVTEHQKAEIREFFEVMKRLEPGKWVKLKGFGSRRDAEKLIERARKRAES